MIRAKDIHTPEDELYAVLCWASRSFPTVSPQMRKLLKKPEILDYLERVVAADRVERKLPT